MLKLSPCPNPNVRFDHATHASTRADVVETGAHLRSALVWLCALAQFIFSPFPAPCRLSTLALAPVPNPSLFCFLAMAASTPPRRANPSPLLFPPSTQAHAGSAPWSMLSPPHDPPVLPFHAASTSWCAAPPPPSTHYKMPWLPSFIPIPSNLKQSSKNQSSPSVRRLE